jgi:hypothetical protein
MKTLIEIEVKSFSEFNDEQNKECSDLFYTFVKQIQLTNLSIGIDNK